MRKLSLKWEDIRCGNQVEIEYQIMPRFEKRGFGLNLFDTRLEQLHKQH